MKKNLFTSLVLLALSIPSFAQFNYGVQAGLGLSDFNNNNESTKRHFVGGINPVIPNC